MKVTYSKQEIAENPAVRAAIVGLIANAKHGGFMAVSGFRPKTGHGEVQNAVFCKGICYGNVTLLCDANGSPVIDENGRFVAAEKSGAKGNSFDALMGIFDKRNTAFSITVTRGVWKNAAGAFSPTGRKSKEYGTSGTVTKTYTKADAALLSALAKVLQGLVAPAPASKEYAKLGNGVYEADGIIYLRDLRSVSKTVIVHGDYPFSASGEETAIADALRRDMPVGKYREFRLDGDYDAITLDGMELATADAPAPADVPQVKTDATPVAVPAAF